MYILKARHVLTPTKSSAPMAAGVVQARHELPARLGAVSHAVSAEEQCFYAPRALAGTYGASLPLEKMACKAIRHADGR